MKCKVESVDYVVGGSKPTVSPADMLAAISSILYLFWFKHNGDN